MATQSGTRGMVVVTGASTGIGRACALRLARAGFRVFAGVRREADAEALRRDAPRLMPIMLDVTEAESIAAAAAIVGAAAGEAGLAGLVNNAGIALGAPLEFVALDDLRRQLEVNVIGQVAVTQAFLPLLRAGRGRIVNMGSISGLVAPPFLGPYSASKFALEALSDALRVELRPWGIAVIVVEPGGIATPIWEKSLAVATEQERRMPPQAWALYGTAIKAVKAASRHEGEHGLPPAAVARAVLHALSAPRPRARYLIGRGGRLPIMLAHIIPTRLRDRLIVRTMRLPKEPPC